MKLLFGIKSMDVPGGGAERVLSIVASGLAARGHDVTILTFDEPGGESFYHLDPRISRIGLGIGPTDGPTGPGAFARRIPALRKAVLDLRPDVVVGFMHSMFVPLGLSMIGAGIPLVASEHIVPEHYNGRRFEFALFEIGCRLAARVTVLSDSVKALYPARLQKKMVAMPNPVVEYPDCEVDPAGDSKPVKTVLSVGRLEPQKDHATLIEAFAQVSNDFPDWNLRIVGDGSLRCDLEGAVSRLDIEGRVTLPGSTRRIDEEYARAQLMAVSSRFESFGMVTAEALAAGLPVVGFADCPGTNELIHHDNNGWLVGGPGRARIESLAEGLARLMSDDAIRVRLGSAGPASVERYTPEHVVTKWITLLEDAIAGL